MGSGLRSPSLLSSPRRHPNQADRQAVLNFLTRVDRARGWEVGTLTLSFGMTLRRSLTDARTCSFGLIFNAFL